ncbi:hypothetical protein DMC61_40065 [Amycolatopsis sp. WAC 04169]|nr:hypothetical protein DMC61_40065 [Amycolatopsis sp. WAC 04169]
MDGVEGGASGRGRASASVFGKCSQRAEGGVADGGAEGEVDQGRGGHGGHELAGGVGGVAEGGEGFVDGGDDVLGGDSGGLFDECV